MSAEILNSQGDAVDRAEANICVCVLVSNIGTVYHKNFINMCAAVLTNGFLKGMIHKIEDL